MADIAITAANVKGSTSATRKLGTAGATITAGQVVYFDNTAGTWKLAQADGTASEAGYYSVGIALHGASANQPLAVAIEDTEGLTAGGTLTEGAVYAVSETAGGLAPLAEVSTTDSYVTVLGVAQTAALLVLKPIYSGGQVPA